MRFILCLSGIALLSAPISAQTLSAELLTDPTILPTSATLMGPVGLTQTIGAQAHTAVPTSQSLPVQFDWFSGAAGQFAIQTSAGATSLDFAGQTAQLRLDPAIPFFCPQGRPCAVIATNPHVLEAQLDPFEIMLIEPVPDPDGGCETISGLLHSATAMQLSAPLVTLTAMPAQAPLYAPEIAPGTPPALLPEEHHMLGPVSVQLAPPGAVNIRICGDAPDLPEGRLSYTMIQSGTDWRWETQGLWTIRYTPDGQALARHELLENQYEGLLIDVFEGGADILEMSWETALTPSGDDAYRLSFNPDPSAFDNWVLEFEEPSGLPHSTGRTNTQSVNHPGALAISYLFRHYLAGADAILPMTPAGPEDISPSLGAPGGPPLSLTLLWEQSAD